MTIIKSYVPIIRWRSAEIKALKNLYPEDRDGITPLFEFIMPPPNTDKDDYKKILEDSKSKFLRKLPNIAQDIAKCWGQNAAFVDVHLLDGDIRASAFEQILSSTGDLDLFSIPVVYIIPVVGTQSDAETRSVAVKFAKINKRGLCIRIDESHFDNKDLFQEIESFVKSNGLDFSTIDILVDLKIIDENMAIKSVIEKLSNIPHIMQWRSLILTGGSFPKDLSNLEKHSHSPINRFDWNLWKVLSKENKIERCPIFSDYTIQHPIYYGYVLRANISASIRYTSDETWEILRGEGLKNEKGAGYRQYPAQAQLLSEQSFFKGSTFSFGDAYIVEKAKPGKTTGSPQTWLTAGINHHLTLVVRQISSLP